ncbi:MAG: penicillin-binding protein 1A [Alphaproteobacteria bacterium]
MRVLAVLFFLFLLFVAAAGGGGFYLLYYYGRGLPDYQQLANYEPPTMTRVHAGDGQLLAEYATERRIFVPVTAMPRRVIDAFLAAEDKNFYQHPGVDFTSVARAMLRNIAALGKGKRLQGASTITQQVAKNFLLTNEVSIERKVKEAILAFRIEKAFSKDRILELYLNEIYLGKGSYGVAAASLNYFNKSLDALTIAETAYLAALPKAPNNYHPVRHRKAATTRRNWVIGRMLEEGFIEPGDAARSKAEPLITEQLDPIEFTSADYFKEAVRRRLIALYGKEQLYEGGLSVRTTVDPKLQAAAEKALRDTMIEYDRRHGWRGPLTNIDASADWEKQLAAVPRTRGQGDWLRAAVLALDDRAADIGLVDGSRGRLDLAELIWARAWKKGQRIGAEIVRPRNVLALGDVVLVQPVPPDTSDAGQTDETMPADPDGDEPPPYGLRQIPEISGALVALDPHTGRVLAMVGGFSYDLSEFNRATQAKRQPGSSFKPIVYMAALDGGYTPASIVDDAPIVIDQGPDKPKWKPANYTTKFYGRAPLRIGIEKSRNLMTVRLARVLGMDTIADYANRFGVADDLPPYLPMALGAGETTLLRMATAYAIIVNGGKRVKAALIERIQDRNGSTIYRRDSRPCDDCMADRWKDQAQPRVADGRTRVIGADTAYQMVWIMRGVVERGTGRRIRSLGKPLAGKTGTTNENKDAWFIGFSPDLVAGVFMGFDRPIPLGYKETGSRVAVPAFKRFMAEALADKPAIPFRIPRGIRLVRIDGDTGLLPSAASERVILEAFKPGTEPTSAIPTKEAGAEGLY